MASDGSGVAMALPLSCRSVNRCRCCAIAKGRRDRARAFMGASSGKVAMVTLTIDPQDGRFHDPANRTGRDRPRTSALVGNDQAYVIEQSLRYQSWAWNRLRTSLSRRGKVIGSMAYFRGVELHKSGMAHVHVLVRVESVTAFMLLRSALRGDESKRTTVPVNDRRAGLAIRAGFGRVVDVQLARNRGDVARYVTKDVAAYVTKGVTAAMPRYTRRSAYSRAWAPGWVKPTPIAGFDWRLASCSADVAQRALIRSDFVIGDPERFRVVSAPTGAGGLPA
jgi:hypothetical protein